MSSRRLIAVSNRVPPPPRADEPWPAGGLVSALLPALECRQEAVWFGWSGSSGDPYAPLSIAEANGVEYVTLDLSARQIEQHYAGFCNRVLWPWLHSLGHGTEPEPEEFQTYRAVNRRFATALFPLLGPDDLVWIHDYHLFSAGTELRRLGWQGPIGFFNHTPIPSPERWGEMRYAGHIAGYLEAYDLVGVQTSKDAAHLRAVLARGGSGHIGVYPVSIDPERFRSLADGYGADPLRHPGKDRELMIGVDRLDYTKGIGHRLEAFERLLTSRPALRDRVHFVQWAAPSRSSVPEYRAERMAVEEAALRIERCFGQPSPVTLDVHSHPPDEVAAALRSADICVITSLADGMNLVAKEFCAVHSDANPGVVILSDTCGAAEELDGALLVRSTDTASIERAMRVAVEMPLHERRRRSRALRSVVDTHTTHRWLDRFERDLCAVAASRQAAGRRRERALIAS